MKISHLAAGAAAVAVCAATGGLAAPLALGGLGMAGSVPVAITKGVAKAVIKSTAVEAAKELVKKD